MRIIPFPLDFISQFTIIVDWEQRKLGELLENGIIIEQSDGNHGELYPKNSEFSLEGIPYISASDIKDSRIDFSKTKYLPLNRAEKFRKGKAKEGDILLAHNATVGPTVQLKTKYPFVILSTTLTLYRINNKFMNPKFFLYALKSSNIQTQLQKMMKQTTRNQVPILAQRTMTIKFPDSIDEQQQLGDFLTQLDCYIALHQRKYGALLRLKEAYLQNLFPKNGESVPKLRFANFDEEWEQRKLGDISEKVTKKNVNNKYYETLTNSAEFGIVSQREFFDKDISNENNLNNYYIVQPDDFVYNPRISNFAPVGPIKRNKIGRTGVMSPLYYVFRTYKIDKTYLETYFASTNWHKFMSMNGDSGARSDRFAIKDSVFREMPIPTTSSQEESKIGDFFKKLDGLIIFHQRKLDQLQKLKKAFLQKLFL